MIKPILKIELPTIITQEDRELAEKTLFQSSAKEDYHILIIYTDITVPSLEIIIAPDASIHKP